MIKQTKITMAVQFNTNWCVNILNISLIDWFNNKFASDLPHKLCLIRNLMKTISLDILHSLLRTMNVTNEWLICYLSNMRLSNINRARQPTRLRFSFALNADFNAIKCLANIPYVCYYGLSTDLVNHRFVYIFAIFMTAATHFSPSCQAFVLCFICGIQLHLSDTQCKVHVNLWIYWQEKKKFANLCSIEYSRWPAINCLMNKMTLTVTRKWLC